MANSETSDQVKTIGRVANQAPGGGPPKDKAAMPYLEKEDQIKNAVLTSG